MAMYLPHLGGSGAGASFVSGGFVTHVIVPPEAPSGQVVHGEARCLFAGRPGAASVIVSGPMPSYGPTPSYGPMLSYGAASGAPSTAPGREAASTVPGLDGAPGLDGTRGPDAARGPDGTPGSDTAGSAATAGRAQSTGSAPSRRRRSLARDNGRDPQKPAPAESGLGWGEVMHGVSPSAGCSDCASRPHRIATSGWSRSTRARMAWSVTASQPLPRCEAGLPGCTVRARFSSSTPLSAQADRSPVAGGGAPTSLASSVKMFTNERGSGRTWGCTEKDSPMACPGVGYGSWPTMSTRTFASGRVKARRTSSPAGRYPRPAAVSARRKSPIARICGSTGASARAQAGANMCPTGG